MRDELVLIVIRNDESLSPKTNFIVQLIGQNSSKKILYVFKKKSGRFREKWGNNQVQLPSSTIGIITYYFLTLLKSFKDYRDGLMFRLSLQKRKHVLTGQGFLTTLSRVLYLHFGTSARANRLLYLLKKMNSPSIFLIDEFLSLNCLDLKRLRHLGSIIYVSSDVAYKRFGFGDNFITRKLMFRLERDAVVKVDLVVACSEMERLAYVEMGARKAVFYPNIYPTEEFEPCDKDEMPSVSIVLRGHWGSIAEASLETILNALAYLNRQIRVYMIGIRPEKVPKNVKLKYWNFVPSKIDYLKLLSKSWIGINVGIHMAGTNERKYDYAEAGVVVLSDALGARGDLLAHEYTYVDSHDLAAKIEQLLDFGKVRLIEMGEKNRNGVLSMAEEERRRLLKNIAKIISDVRS
jgi:glycosyltransferase involved in cell wall biosynthesis